MFAFVVLHVCDRFQIQFSSIRLGQKHQVILDSHVLMDGQLNHRCVEMDVTSQQSFTP
jgi:hypothetical protein